MTRAAYGAPLYQLHRRDLHDVLVKALQARAPGTVHLNHDAVSIEQVPSGGARVTFANGAVAEGDLVVGCDGIRSNIRQAVFGKEDPLFTKIIAWRALVPADRLPKEFLDDPTGVHVGPDSNVTHYLVRDGTLVNYLCFARVEAWEEEGWRIPSKLEPVMERFKDYHPLIRQLIVAAISCRMSG